MKKIILLSLMMVLGLNVVRGQQRLVVSGAYIHPGITDSFCNNYIFVSENKNEFNFWRLSRADGIKTDKIFCSIQLENESNFKYSNYIISNDSVFMDYDTSDFTLYNLPDGTYTISWSSDSHSYDSSIFTVNPCIDISGDSLGSTDTSLIYCGNKLSMKNINFDTSNSKSFIWRLLPTDTIVNIGNIFTYSNLPDGYDTIIYGGQGNFDTITIKIEDCLIDVVDTLSESIINNKNCVDGDSILNFKFNFTNNQNSDTDYYFNYSKFQWVIKDSIGKTVDNLVTKDDDEIFLNSLSGLKGKDTLYCTAMSEYFDTTVSISFTVNPYPTLNISLRDTSINLGDSVQLIANSNGSVTWSPSAGLSCTNCSNPVADPSTTITYTATSTEGTCEISDTVTITVITTGINQQSVKNNNSSIYPNPSPGQFTIQLNDNKNNYTVEIYNVLGEKIYYSVLNNTHSNIDLSSHPAGVYFVYLKSKEDVNVEKVLITK
jgi:hypothetical protein